MFRWYAINTYSGHENKVKANLEHRIDSMAQQPRFRRVVVPTEQVVETRDGQKVQTEKRILPGYVPATGRAPRSSSRSASLSRSPRARSPTSTARSSTSTPTSRS